jgi:damage-control phosphatase, subfamily I
MKTSLDCIPCLVQQCLKVARLATADEKVQEEILRETLRHVSQLDLARPPMLGQWIYRQVRQRTGQADPYLVQKQESNRLALALFPAWKQRVLASENPLTTAVRLAIAANIIDFGINGDLKPEDIPSALEKSFASLLEGDVGEFLDAVARTKDILYLADNAGELVFDRLFIELLARKNITVAVKGGPAINDALRIDAEAAGLLGLVEVIDNGTDGAGTLLETCSAEFRWQFERAHLIIAKGQANYETLDDYPREIFFLLKIKCTRVGRYLLQDALGHVWKPLGDTKRLGANVGASVLIVTAWGYFLIQGVRDPLGGVNSLWPLFGIANQLLSVVALCLATTIILKMQLQSADLKTQSASSSTSKGQPWFALITLVPLAWLMIVTVTAGLEKTFSSEPKIGFLAQARRLQTQQPALHQALEAARQIGDAAGLSAAQKNLVANHALHFNNTLDAAVAGGFLALVAIIVLLSVREWLRLLARRRSPVLSETTPVGLPDHAVATPKPQ